MSTKKISNRRMVFLLFILCWFVYFSSYIGRRNFSAVMPQMILEGILTTAQAGTINTIFFLCYGCGQLINGILADRMVPSKMIFFGAVISAVSNLIMGASSSFMVMALIWACNGYALSMLWAPCVRLFADMLMEKDRVRCMVNMSSPVAIGNILSYVLCAVMVSLSGWRLAFYSSAVVVLAAAVLWAILYHRIAKHREMYGVEEEHSISRGNVSKVSLWALLGSLSMVILLVSALMQGMLRDGITSWVPSFITENFDTAPAFSSLVTTVLPLFNLIGPYAAHAVNKKIQNELLTSAGFFSLSLVSLLGLLFLGHTGLFASILFFAAVTTCIEAVNVMLISLIPLRYSQMGRAATMSGVLNFCTYVGSAISTFGVGLLVEQRGWNFALGAWNCFAVVGVVMCLAGRKFMMKK